MVQRGPLIAFLGFMTVLIVIAILQNISLPDSMTGFAIHRADTQSSEIIRAEYESNVDHLAAINGLQPVKAGEFAVIHGAEESLEKEDDFVSYNGVVIPVSSEVDESLMFIPGTQEGVTYVPDSPEVEIKSFGNEHLTQDEDTALPSGKVDAAVYTALQKGERFEAVVELNVPYQTYYEEGQGRFKAWKKQRDFKNTKTIVEGAASKTGKMNLKAESKLLSALVVELDDEALAQLEENEYVSKVSYLPEYHLLLDESVAQIHAPEIWNLFDAGGAPLTGTSMRIAVLDTGIDYTHPDFGACTRDEFLAGHCEKVIGGRNFMSNTNDPMDDHGHGTHVASTVAGRGIASGNLLLGVAPDAKLIVYKVCDASGCPGSAILSAIDYAVDPNRDGDPSDHVDVATMSLGGPGDPDDVISQAADEATAAGVVVTVAAGNSGPGASTIGSPGVARSVITVAAACKSSQIGSTCSTPIASFSSRGPVLWNGSDLQKPDISAPGVLICAARWDSSFGTGPYQPCYDTSHVLLSGTSMATPHVAGVAALMRQAYPAYTPTEIKALLKATARDLGRPYDEQGAGLVDLRAAIPFNAQGFATPLVWTITSDPTHQNNTFEKDFSIQVSNASILSLSPSISTVIPGIELTINTSLVSFTSGENQTYFKASAVIDNLKVAPGNYYTSLILSEGTTPRVRIPVFITVQQTISISPTAIDYGFNDPSLRNWTSDNRTISVTNMLRDVSLTFNISYINRTGSMRGINVSYPSKIILPASGTIHFDTLLNVNNLLTPDGRYEGNFHFNNSVYSINFPLTVFSKQHVLIIDFNETINANTSIELVWVRGQTTNFVFGNIPSNKVKTNPHRVVVSNGTYDIMVKYKKLAPRPCGLYGSCPYDYYYVFKENVSVYGEKIVNLTYTLAQNKLILNFSDANGRRHSELRDAEHDYSQSFVLWRYKPTNYKLYYFDLLRYYGFEEYRYFSNFSSNYAREDLFFNPRALSENISAYYFFYGNFSGPTRDILYSNTPAQLNKFRIKADNGITNFSYNSRLLVCFELYQIIQFGGERDMACSYRSTESPPFGKPYIKTFYSNYPPRTLYVRENIVDCTANKCAIIQNWTNTFATPLIDISTQGRRYSSEQGWDISANLTAMGNKVQYLGLGPSFISLRFNNIITAPLLVNMSSNYVDNSFFINPVWEYYTGYAKALPVIRQDFSITDHSPIKISVYRAGVLLNETTLPSFSRFRSYPPLSLPQAGWVELRANITYGIGNQTLEGMLQVVYNTQGLDPKPPTLTGLGYFINTTQGELRSEYYVEGVRNRVEFTLDPVGGALQSANAAYSTNGQSFISLPVQNISYLNFSAVLPPLSNIEKVYIRVGGIEASSLNSINYTFVLPWGPAMVLLSPDGYRWLTVYKYPTYRWGTIEIAPAGIACGTDCYYGQDSVALNSSVTLTATPVDGVRFEGWISSDTDVTCSGTGPCSLLMSKSRIIYANFTNISSIQTMTLAVTVNGSGSVRSIPSGIDCGAACNASFIAGTNVTLTATPTAGNLFTGWGGDAASCGVQSSCSVTMETAKNVTATFIQHRHILSVAMIGTGAGTVTSSPAGIDCGVNCSSTFPAGTMVTLTATAAGSNSFSGWISSDPGFSCDGIGICTILLDQARFVSANFTLVSPTLVDLTIGRLDVGHGTVFTQPFGFSCSSFSCGSLTFSVPFNSLATLTAEPLSGSYFNGWISNDPGFNCTDTTPTGSSCILRMDSSKRVHASFLPYPPVLLSVSKDGSGVGTVTSSPAGIDCGAACNALFDVDTLVTLTATPAANSIFGGWSGVCSGTNLTCTITMDMAKSVTATFTSPQQEMFKLSVTRSGTGSGNVSSNPAGIACGNQCDANFSATTVVTLSAAPAPGSTFSGWGGDAASCGTQLSCILTMDAARSANAVFTLTQEAFASPIPGLIARYTFDGSFLDSSGNNNHATPLNGAALVTLNGSDSAVEFDGVNDYLSVEHSPSLAVTNGLSISLWAQPRSGTNNGLVFKGPLTNSQGVWTTVMGSTYTFRLNGGNDVYSTSAPSYNAWTHIVATYGDGEQRIYIDGALQGSVPYTTPLTANTDGLYLGIYYASPYVFDGRMNNVVLFNRSLTASEVAQLYTNPSLTAPAHPADTDNDYRIILEEWSAYNRAYKLQESWPTPPSPPTSSYYTRVLLLYKLGGRYVYNQSVTCPLCWARA